MIFNFKRARVPTLPWVLTISLSAGLAFAGTMHWFGQVQTAASPRLAAWMPPGALLTIESGDFAKLVQQWQTSPEQRAWLASENYAAFSRSRLFGRLQEAQAEFAGAAGVSVDKNFLAGVAGQQSFFAWYDIGKLQVIYITHMAPEVQKRSKLLNQAGRFERREAGGVPFFVHSGIAGPQEAAPDATANGASMTADDASQDADSPSDETRSVAFATKGEWLVLATDEQLIARTLELMSAADAAGNDSLAAQSWYADALARAPVQAGKLRMAIDLSRVIRSPHFRTYWIQQNITELSHYRAALCDLYQDASGFREERILLPATHDEDSKAASLQNADLSSLTVLVPPGSAVYRAVAHPSEQDVLATLNDKLLRRSAWGAADSNAAPHAILSTPQAGRDSDLETRIDEPDTAPTGAQNAEQTLQTLLNTLQVNAMLTLETHAATIQTSSTWIPFHAAIVLELGQPPDPKAVQSALSEAIRPDLTAGALGTAWTPVAGGFLITSDAHPLVLAVDGKRVLIANDPDLLKAILSRRQIHPDAHAIPALLMTGFDASGTRPFFLRWTAIVDGLDKAPSTNQPSPDDGNPPFLGKNIASLSNAFRQYSAEKFTARQDGEIVRQTVDYVF